MKLIKQIPNFLTLINLILGASACILILEQPGENIIEKCNGQNYSLPVSADMAYIASACFLLVIAAIIDFLDGFVARFLNASSAIGEQLDSLADMISFGLAPGMIMYKLLQLSYATQLTALDYPNYYFHFALFIPVCAAIRLARFNSENVNNTYFTGLPTPASALFIISIPLIMMRNPEIANELTQSSVYFYCITLILGVLMISNIKLFSLKIKKLQLKGNKLKLSMIIIALILFSLFNYLSIPMIILTYIILSLTLYKTNKDEL